MQRKTLLLGTLVLCFTIGLVLVLSFASLWAKCEKQSKNVQSERLEEKTTRLRFYFHDTLSGKNPSAVLVVGSSAASFGSIFAINDPLTEGPEATSTVIGNAQGLYASTGTNQLSLVMYVDFGFTSGEYSGSSISVFSRNPVADGDRELAVVGGRGKFRMARGYANLKTLSSNAMGDAIVQYDVTLLHY